MNTVNQCITYCGNRFNRAFSFANTHKKDLLLGAIALTGAVATYYFRNELLNLVCFPKQTPCPPTKTCPETKPCPEVEPCSPPSPTSKPASPEPPLSAKHSYPCTPLTKEAIRPCFTKNPLSIASIANNEQEMGRLKESSLPEAKKCLEILSLPISKKFAELYDKGTHRFFHLIEKNCISGHERFYSEDFKCPTLSTDTKGEYTEYAWYRD